MKTGAEEGAWPQVEFAAAPRLEEGQANMLDMHSLLNVLNLLVGEIEVLGLRLNGQAEAMPRSLAVCRTMADAARNPSGLASCAREAGAHANVITDELADLLQQFPDGAKASEVREGCAAIESILGILRVRAQELLARGPIGSGGEWRTVSADEIQEKLLEVFSAIHTQSRGRHNFIFEPTEEDGNAYLVVMRLETGGAGSFSMPPVLNDVIRDLMANARKYTPAGGRITLELRQSAHELELAVSDNGRGIPEDEIAKVTEFGYRASNAQDRRTYGGGFGLTKALWVANQEGGRMWIASKLGIGTRVRIVLPRP